MKKNLLVMSYAALLSVFCGFSQSVGSVEELQSALENADVGTVITMQNGEYNDADLFIEAFGTASNPIIIQAETRGEVILDNCRIVMSGEYITLKGVVFTGEYDFEELGSDSYVIRTGYYRQECLEDLSLTDCYRVCNNCTITQVKIDDYNPSLETDDFRWVRLFGQYTEVSYCTFMNKSSIGSMLFSERSEGKPDYTKIHHNYFAYRNQVGEVDEYNNLDAMRIGNSDTSLTSSFTEVYDNYFYEVNGGEPEFISNKSCDNKYYNNTFSGYLGALSLRHGNDCEVYNNFFFKQRANRILF